MYSIPGTRQQHKSKYLQLGLINSLEGQWPEIRALNFFHDSDQSGLLILILYLFYFVFYFVFYLCYIFSDLQPKDHYFYTVRV